MKIKNKKGDLRENMLGVIIAVLGIAFLAYVAVQIYNVAVSGESANARKSLDFLVGKIDALEEGQSGKFLVQGFQGAENWYLTGWSKNDATRPDKCSLDSCVCVCKAEAVITFKPIKDSATRCQEGGFCRKFSVENIKVQSFTLNNGVEEIFTDYISLPKNIKELSIIKSKSEIIIKSECKDCLSTQPLPEQLPP